MSETESSPIDLRARLNRCQALLDASEAIAVHRDLPTLFHDLAQRLPRIVDFNFLLLLLYDAATNRMKLHTIEGTDHVGEPPPQGLALEETPAGIVWQTQRPMVIGDREVETRFPPILPMWRQNNVKSACLVPLTTAQRRVGALAFGSHDARPYSDADLELLMRVGTQVALAVDNALNYEAAQTYQQQLACERDRLRVLLEITNAVVTNLDLRDLLAALSASLRGVTSLDYLSIASLEQSPLRLRMIALDFPGGPEIDGTSLEYREDYPPWRAIESRQPVLIDSASDLALMSEIAPRYVEAGLQSGCVLPLVSRDRVIGTLNVGSRREDAFSQGDVDMLCQVAGQVAIALDTAQAFRQIEALKNQLAKEKLYLEDEIRTEHNFGEIVGSSDALRRVLKQVETVAPTDSTVLVLGETGTGKEVMARAIHNLSSRRERTFVKINCAAIPSGLLESELFGHERGAFTGAISQKVGRFELAHQGTLFLDEIGDIPLELQPKLLRVLQEHEFERLGGTRTQRVDVRVVAATNRDLAGMVAEKEFRSDLYYRLNVFPIRVPPLRERPEDVPLLVRYFAQKFARRLNRQLESLPNETLQALCRYAWPGNLRELQNIVERAVIVSPGPVLQIPLSELQSEPSLLLEAPLDGGLAALEAAERRMIMEALRATHGIIGGTKGAAARLGLKRTTLAYRMQKLGIPRQTE